MVLAGAVVVVSPGLEVRVPLAVEVVRLQTAWQEKVDSAEAVELAASPGTLVQLAAPAPFFSSGLRATDMKKAWIENDRIRDICPGDPAELYHPDVAALYSTDVPDNAANGDGWINGALVKPVVPVPVEPPAPVVVPPSVSSTAFKMLFTSAERIKAKQLRATDEILDDCWDLFDSAERTNTPINLALASVQSAVEYTLTVVNAAGVTLDVAARKAEILTGVVQ